MTDIKGKTNYIEQGSEGGTVYVDEISRHCPLTRDLRTLRFDPSVIYYRNHIWSKECDGQIKVGLDDLAQKLLQPVKAWIGPSAGTAAEKGEHLFWVETLGGLVSFESPFDGAIAMFNDTLYHKPTLPGKEPYGSGWVLSIREFSRTRNSEVAPVPAGEALDWLGDEAIRWEKLLVNYLGLGNDEPGATADGGIIVTDPWIALGPRGMQKMFAAFFNPL